MSTEQNDTKRDAEKLAEHKAAAAEHFTKSREAQERCDFEAEAAHQEAGDKCIQQAKKYRSDKEAGD